MFGEGRQSMKDEGISNVPGPWVAWCLDHWTPDRKAWVRCPKPPNTLRTHTEYKLVKSVGPKVLWAGSRLRGTREYFRPLQFHGKIVEVEIFGVAIFRTFRNFAELIRTVTCMVLSRRTSSPLPGRILWASF
ncbi:hypothetical protein TNCV_2096511 [Trichonephila clavipes]|nr:hypothetical protein TNCV_2096511 [Trichonephila clavipes]